jgi:hypothetical protein
MPCSSNSLAIASPTETLMNGNGSLGKIHPSASEFNGAYMSNRKLECVSRMINETRAKFVPARRAKSLCQYHRAEYQLHRVQRLRCEISE